MNSKKRTGVRLLGKILFLLYMAFLIWFLIFSDWYGRTGISSDYRYNLELFKEIKRFWYNRETLGMFAVFTNLAGNVLIFAPLGFFLPMASRYHSFFSTLFLGFGISLCVEVFQLITRVGSFDVDDLFLNTCGAVVGYIVFIICNVIRRNYGSNKTKNKKYYTY